MNKYGNINSAFFILKKKILYLLVFFLFSPLLFSQQFTKVDSLYNVISSIKNPNNQNIFDVLKSFNWGSKTETLQYYRRIINLASRDNNKYLKCYFLYSTSWLCDFPAQRKLLDQAFSIAEHEKYYSLMGIIDMAKGIDFKQNSMLDSAMTFCLAAKTYLERVGDTYSLVDVLLTIADMHYDAGQLTKAEEMYRKIQIIKGEPVGWKSWRKAVVLNDLGLIRINQGKYPEAENYFMSSLKFKIESTGNHLSHNDSAQVEYIYRKLSEIYLLENNIDEAQNYINLSLAFTNSLGLSSEFAPVYIDKGKLDYLKGNYDSAALFYKKAESYGLIYPDVKNKVSLYDGLSKTYAALNEFKNEAGYLMLLKKAKDSYDSTFYSAKYMSTYAEYNYNNYLAQIASDKKIQLMLTIIILIISLSLLTITYFFIRLKRSKQRLVEKSIELATNEPYVVSIPEKELEINTPLPVKENLILVDEKETKELDTEILNDIKEKLEQKVSNEKIFLNADLTISGLAEMLGTNRTYLSKAIVKGYNMNFVSYVNELRIKEAIRFISYGEHFNLNIDGIAQKAGFNNRVSFTKAFQKFTGVSPSFFIKNAGQVGV